MITNSTVPVAGSAYTFSYATFGELIAWIIEWDLVLELALGAATVSVGRSGYLDQLLSDLGVALPASIAGETAGVNIPAMVVALLMTGVLVLGIKLSSRVTSIIVVIEVAIVLLVIVFFAFIGFDIVATAAEETTDPAKDLPRGIFGSLAVCTVLYVLVSLVVVGMQSYTELNAEAPLAGAFSSVGLPFFAGIISIGALAGLTSVVMILMLGQSRVLFAMSRDHLLPPGLAKVHPTYGTPYRITLITGVAVAIMAGLIPLGTLAELVNIGTLFAFVLVSIGVVVLRRTRPELPRAFRVPLMPVLPIVAALASFYLMLNLPTDTWIRFGIWMGLGVVVYYAYGRRHSRLAAGGDNHHDHDSPDVDRTGPGGADAEGRQPR